MAGANGKLNIGGLDALDREKEWSPLRVGPGPEYHRRDPTIVTSNVLTPALQASDLIFNAATPNAITGPTAVQVIQYFQQLAQDQGIMPMDLARFQQIYENTDPTFSKVITFPAGFNPAVITLPPLTTAEVAWEQHTLTSPPTFTLFSQLITTSGIPAAGGVTSWQGDAGAPRVGAVHSAPGDYNTTDITKDPAVLIPGATATDALNNLITDIAAINGTGTAGPFTQKVNYLVTPTVPVALDLLVNIAGGNDYHPSGTTLAGHIGGLQVSQTDPVFNAVNTAELQVDGGGSAVATAFPTGALINARGTGAAGWNNAGFALIRADSSIVPTFGQGGNTQTNFRSINAPALPSATGGNGAYSFETDVSGVKVAFVNANGWTAFTPSGTAGTAGAVLAAPSAVAGVNILTLTASTRAVKDSIRKIEEDTSWLLKLPVRNFQYKRHIDPDGTPQVGAIVDEAQNAGASPSFFAHHAKEITLLSTGEKTQVTDIERPRAFNLEACFFGLLNEFQKAIARIEALENPLPVDQPITKKASSKAKTDF